MLLPLIRLFADMDNPGGGDMPSLSAPAVAEIAIEEFGFRPQMILRQCLGVGLQLGCRNWLACLPIECALCRLADIPIECRNGLGVQLLPWAPALRFGPLLSIRQFELRPSMKGIQEIERLHLVGVFTTGIERLKPFQ